MAQRHIQIGRTADVPENAPELQGDEMILIGGLAERAGVNPSTIRFYEREGLIAPQKIGRWRIYTAADAEKLKAIIRLRKIGLPINKVRKALDLSRSNDVGQGLQGLTKIFEEQIVELQRLCDLSHQQLENATKWLRELDDKQSNKDGA